MNDEELDYVIGGGKWDNKTIGNYYFSGHVSRKDGIIGEYYYITEDGTDNWCYGQLVKKWSDTYFLWIKDYWNEFIIYSENGVDCRWYPCEIPGETWTMYKNMVHHEVL